MDGAALSALLPQAGQDTCSFPTHFSEGIASTLTIELLLASSPAFEAQAFDDR